MNRLGDATSPYLLQHASNPVDWYPWGEEAFAAARERDRPLLVSVGYSACHWCHVMEHESFSDPATAALMNELFVNVKVDREERPDVDALTMDACVTMTGQGGWPTTVFLTPDGRPFYAGTYFPPTPRHGIPSFAQLLPGGRRSVGRAQGRPRAAGGAARRRARRGRTARAERRRRSAAELLDAAERGLARAFEPAFGGFGGAPEVPAVLGDRAPPPSRWAPEALEMVTRTLDGMAAGGMWDVVGGGFHRYSVDARWLVPHFEKMLYDNALLASAYLHAWVVTGEARYRVVVDAARVDYLLRELRAPRRRARVGPGRRHRRGGGAHVHLDAGGVGGARARRRRCSSPSSTAAASSAATLDEPTTRAGCSRFAPDGRSRSATTRRSPRGTASRSRRSRRRGAGSTAPTALAAAVGVAEFLLTRAARRRRTRAAQLARRDA